MSFNNLLRINTNSNAPLGHFGKKMVEYGECHIGEEFWLKHGLTLQDKANFESYQQLCREMQCADLEEINKYEDATPTAMRDKIIDALVEINDWYQIGNALLEEEDEKEKDEKEKEEINASYARMIALENCATCNHDTESGISFCNATCENKFDVKNITHGGSVYINASTLKRVAIPTVRMEGATSITGNLYEELDKSEIANLVIRNQRKLGWVVHTLSSASFESLLSPEETAIKISKFLESIPNMVVDEVAAGMFYKCHYSEEFDEMTTYIKLHFGQDKTMIETRRVHGSASLGSTFYTKFTNHMLNENKSTHLVQRRGGSGEDPFTTSDEDVDSLCKFIKQNLTDGIKVGAYFAMKQEIGLQIITCNEIYNAIHTSPRDISFVAVKILGFIDMLKTHSGFKLKQEYRDLVIPRLKNKLDACSHKIRNLSVKRRIEEI